MIDWKLNSFTKKLDKKKIQISFVMIPKILAKKKSIIKNLNFKLNQIFDE